MLHGIKNLNYIVSGSKEKIINMDIDETKNWSFVTDDNTDLNNNSLAEAYNSHRMLKIIEPSSGNHNVVYTLFDFKDIAIKSDFSNVPVNSVYGPKLDSNPAGFCKGVGTNAFGLTNTSKTAALTTGTNLLKIRQDRLNGYRTTLNWNYKLEDGDYSTFEYPTLKSLGEDISSYYSYIFQNPSLSSEIFDKIFTPENNLSGTARNFIYEFFTGSNFNDYNTGNFHGNVFAAKNAFDGKYSMNMTREVELRNARNYVDIGAVGGHLFLKYYDTREYNTTETSPEIDNDGTKTYAMTTVDNNRGNTYQKVEILDSINRFVTRSNHKANLYSIKLNSLGLESHPSLKNNLNKIKQDIQKNVRMIAEKLAPAHTQLFKVYIES